MNNSNNHIKFLTETKNDSTVESYTKSLLREKPGAEIKVIKEASWWPITNLLVNIPDIGHPWIVHHSPNSVHMISSITTQWIEETKGKIYTLVWWEVFHPPAAAVIPTFPAGWIDPEETIEEAWLREMSEEMPVLKPEWIQSVECLSGKHNSIGRSTEKSYTLHIKAQLPEWMSIDELDGHIGWVYGTSERIRSQVEELTPKLGIKLWWNIDIVWLIMVWMRVNPSAFTKFLTQQK